MKISILVCIAVALSFPISTLAQSAVSSGSVGFARTGTSTIGSDGRNILPSANIFRVEEFINYHRHDLPLPTGEQKVRLDVQDLNLENGKTVFQFGLTTPRAIDSSKLPPMNIVLVVDESGSMSGQKIENLKSSLLSFVERFRKTDRLTIVGFEDKARVILESVEKTKFNKITNAIDDIHANGSTNLHAGLMCGYQMALKHFDKERTNRVIFLTDGNANVGVTESKEIARESKKCIKQGISLVTIGLGVDFNHGLLRELADSGRGVMHYVGDAKDIQKVFVDEIDSILAPAARKVKLTLDLDGGTETPKIYGYQPLKEHSEDGSRFVLKLDDLNHGATQVVLLKSSSGKPRLSGTATLAYTDAITKEKVSESVKFSSDDRILDFDKADETENNGKNQSRPSKSVSRNYAIALLASGIRSAAEESNNGNNKKAAKRLSKAISKSKDVYSNREDQHVNRVLKIATNYCNLMGRD